MKMTPGAESEAIVCTVTKSLPINSILNRISQRTPGVLNLLALAALAAETLSPIALQLQPFRAIQCRIVEEERLI